MDNLQKGGEKIKQELKAIAVSAIATIIMILLSILYFAITLFVIKIASDAIFGEGLEQNWAVLGAAIVTMGSMLGASIRKSS